MNGVYQLWQMMRKMIENDNYQIVPRKEYIEFKNRFSATPYDIKEALLSLKVNDFDPHIYTERDSKEFSGEILISKKFYYPLWAGVPLYIKLKKYDDRKRELLVLSFHQDKK